MMNLRHRILPWMPAALFVVCASVLAACQVTEASPYLAAVSTQKEDDSLTVTAQGDRLFVDITSPSGIGAGRATIVSAAQPAAVELRLRLQGLEELRFAYGEQAITVTVSSVGDGAVRESVKLAAGVSVALTPDSPYWMAVTVEQSEPGSTTPTPLFVVQAPRDFLEQGGRTFELSWIDFYR